MVTAEFNGCKMTTARQSLYQYDYEQQLQILGLELPEVFQADFCNAGDASTVSVLGENGVVDIPAQFIADGRDILAYVFYYDEATGGKTRAEITITVMARPERTNEQPTPEQESIIDQAIDALNEGVERAENAADAAEDYARGAETAKNAAEAAQEAAQNAAGAAEQSATDAEAAQQAAETAVTHYPKIVNDFWWVWDAERGEYVNTGVKAKGEDGKGAVLSVNGKTGEVTLDAEDVGALPDNSTLDDIPDGSTYKRPTAAQVQQIATNAANIQTQGGEIDQVQADVDAIEQKIPNQASSTNQLADKAFVNSSINSAAAFFRGAFPTRAALFAVAWQTTDPSAANYVSNNDYAYVADDETHDDEAWRYIYVLQPGGTGNGWQPQFRVNESPLTAAQLAALNSGATAALIEQISTNAAAIALKQAIINASGILKGSGNGQVSAAVAGTDYQTPLTAGTDYATPAQVNAKYTKPSGGIPASDMAQAVQTSLGKADTALQAVPNTYRTAAAQDEIDNGKQPTLVSGQNIKTINGNSVLGSGNMQIQGGVTDVQVAGTSIVQGGVANVPMASASTPGVVISGTVTVTGTTPTITAKPGVRYVCGEVTTLDIILPTSGIVDVTFESGSTATVLTVTPPSGVTLKWANGFDPTALEADTTYEINIMDGLGVAIKWS